MADEVLIETRGRVRLITLNRPEAKNAVNNVLGEALVAAIAELDADTGLTAGVLTGAGGGFSAGMDLKAFAKEGPPASFGRFLRDGSAKPLIAAVEGFALAGGLEMALTCDLIVAARGVKLGIPEVNKGLFAAGGGLFRLPARVPYGVAMEMALTSDPISAEQAHELGLVARLAEPGQAAEVAFELAERIARNAPLAVAVSKQVIRQSQGLTENEAWKLQAPLAARVFGSEDAKEGPRAFAEKRAPNWTGR
ncbi:crotonase/enoyl-CoA hydratase family protein [Myxococcota bacterium]|nr:crotonase/enoyl-CoA hydratase family protein [Myxococcota bacterium]MCZ7619820.1 crotonase/enoyl-CoA hydratase family protein [Myxococcota bacterium]